MPPQPAQVYSDRYEILRQVARGGMAEVYLARDQLLDRRVALKVLFPELSIDRSFVERFRREAQSAANLSHPNIVSVYDWGEEEDTYFIVMEYVDGRPLSAIIRSQGPLLADRAASIGADVASALAFAHRNGVVHRDVKPGNVLLDANEHVKVTDFGIARAANTQENLTQTGAVMGTATYFSPEQAQGYGVDPRSDVYSLGVVLYEMVTGKPPFAGDNPVTIAYKHVREQAVPPREVNPAIPAAFENIVLKAMAKDPDDRYANAEELRADLMRYQQGRTVLANPVAYSQPGPAPDATVVQPVSRDRTSVVNRAGPGLPPEAGPTHRTGTYVILLFAMLAALVVLLFLLGKTLGIFGEEQQAGLVTVPNVKGQLADRAEEILTGQGLTVERELEENEADENVVFDQDPEGDTRIERGGKVVLKISQGAKPVDVPNVVGSSEEDAITALERLGLQAEVTNEPDETVSLGRVVSQDPTPGTPAPKGTPVQLVVSSGKPKVAVPDVVNKDAVAAGDDIVNAGLKVKTVQEASPTITKGNVIRTEPGPGSEVDKGSTVTMYVSTGQETTTSSSSTTSSSTPSTTSGSSTTSSSSSTSTTAFTIVP
jgi:beta-lactam-binding protein with PASTA domain/tRNA A-37 threonylcarbamoyl transferase component Bud32